MSSKGTENLSPEIDPHIYRKLVFDKGPKVILMENQESFQHMGLK
jgi:hypothetical protein